MSIMPTPTKIKLRNCPVCGKVYADVGLGICPRCYDQRREEEKKIIDYVAQHPKSTIKQICDETDANYDLVMEMVQRGQFIATGGHVMYPCSSCGKPITSGLYCPRCLVRLREDIKAASERRHLKLYSTEEEHAEKNSRKAQSTRKPQTDDTGFRKKMHLHWTPGSDKDN
jgi:hypothetical protein